MFVPKAPVNNIPALVQIMAWRRPGDKPLSEPIMVSSVTHICVTRPQWVNTDEKCFIVTLNSDVIMSAIASQITGVSIVYPTLCSRADKKKISKLRVTGLCDGNHRSPPVSSGLLSQRAINMENISIWWHHHGLCVIQERMDIENQNISLQWHFMNSISSEIINSAVYSTACSVVMMSCF